MDRPSATAAVFVAMLLASSVVGAGAGARVASAQSDDGGVLEPIRTISDRIDGFLGWAMGQVEKRVRDPADRDADEAAEDFKQEYNGHSDELEAWANDRVDADTAANVLELSFEVGGDESTVYLVADVTGDEYENTSVVDSTNRSVDETCALEDDAARNAADELDHVEDEFVDEDRDVDSSYLGRLAGRYDDDVDCSFNLNP